MNCGEARLVRPSIGLVGDLRPGQREPEPARLHRHVPRRLSDPGVAELAGGVPARRLSRARTSTRSTPTIEKLIENIRNKHAQPHGAAPAARSAAAAEPAPPRSGASTTRSSKRASKSFELAYRMQMEATDAFDITREPEAHPRDVRRRHAGAADADRPPAARARRALRAGLARRRASRGTTTTTSKSTTASSATECDQADRRAADRPEAARAARRHAGHLGRRVRPHPDRRTARLPARTPARSTAATTTTTASPCGWPAAASRAATSTAPPTSSASRPSSNPVHVHDLHATILHLLGFDHEKLHLPLRRPRLPPHRLRRRQGDRGS